MMKRIGLFLVFLGSMCLVQAQLLYVISGNGANSKSYLLATNKYVGANFTDTIPSIYKCFSNCNKLICEFTCEDYEAINALRQGAVLPDKQSLKDLYTARQWDSIQDAVQLTLNIPAEQLICMKPSYLTTLYRESILNQWLPWNQDTTSITDIFPIWATQRGIPIYGLDNVGETIYMLFDREPQQWQQQQLLNIITSPELELRLERTIRDMYLYGRLQDIAYTIEAPDNRSTISFSDYQVYAKRNVEWVKRLRPYLKQGGAFIVLDADYLGGDKGLIHVLRSAGYRVKPYNKGHYTN